MLSQERSTLPCLYVHTGESTPLGHYGQELMKNMKEHHSQQYWLYNFDGSLMTRLHQREQEIMELKFRLTEELLREIPARSLRIFTPSPGIWTESPSKSRDAWNTN